MLQTVETDAQQALRFVKRRVKCASRSIDEHASATLNAASKSARLVVSLVVVVVVSVGEYVDNRAI